MNQLIPARKTQMSLKTDGSVSRSLTAEKMHFITIRKYHFAHSPLAEIKLSEETVLVRVWVNRHSPTLLEEVEITTTSVKGNL